MMLHLRRQKGLVDQLLSLICSTCMRCAGTERARAARHKNYRLVLMILLYVTAVQ